MRRHREVFRELFVSSKEARRDERCDDDVEEDDEEAVGCC
jgi:hypothetical protein